MILLAGSFTARVDAFGDQHFPNHLSQMALNFRFFEIDVHKVARIMPVLWFRWH